MADLPFSSSPIVGLVSAVGPAAIFWLVISVIVSALKRVPLGGARTHIGKKQDEIEPPFADFDAASSIVGEAWVAGVAKTAQHAGPAIVFGDFVGLTVRPIFEALFPEASARVCVRISSCRLWPSGSSHNRRDIPRRGFGYVVECRKFSEFLTGDIDKVGHPPVYHSHTWVSIG